MLAADLGLTLAALLIEAACGYPDGMYRSIGHPVTWMGRGIAALDRALNARRLGFAGRRLAGILALLLLLGAAAFASFAVGMVRPGWLAGAMAVLVAASLPAQRSLHHHVAAVADALDVGLDAGRAAVSHIVGRNPAHLDAAGVARAAIESLAENFSDGVVAPAVWMAIGGLPGGVFYKAINTADSMIGHRTERHAAFGWAAARLDDLVNLPASRLAALWIVLAGLCLQCDTRGALRAVRRDASTHRSPNAGWPEAAMAGALGLALAGPRVYGDTLVEDGYMGDGRRDATAADIRRALRLYVAACAVQLAVLAVATAATLTMR